MPNPPLLPPICIFTFFTIFAILRLAWPVRASALVATIRNHTTFTDNLLPLLATSNAITEAKALAADHAGNLFILGEVETLDATLPDPNFPPSTAAVTDTLGGTDLFLLKINASSTRREWAVRFGSRTNDVAFDAKLSADVAALYVVAYVPAPVANGGSGAAIYKYSATTGERVWVETYGSATGEEVLSEIALNGADELVATGKVGPRSLLVPNAVEWNRSTAPLICRISAANGRVRRCNAAASLPDTALAEGLSVVVVASGRDDDDDDDDDDRDARAFVVGRVQRDYSRGVVANVALYAFALPGLEQIGGRVVSKPRGQEAEGATRSRNSRSIYYCGSMYESVYEEYDAFARRVNASTDLGGGWNATVGSTRFRNAANVRNGEAREHGRDCVVDAHGNVYVLVDSTGGIAGAGDVWSGRKNSRPAVVVFAPNGSTVVKMQSGLEGSIGTRRMALLDGGVVAFVGSRVNERTRLVQAFLGGVEMGETTLPRVAEEFVPVGGAAGSGGSSGDGTGEEEVDEETKRLVIIAAAVSGGLVAVGAGLVVVCVLISRRASGGAGGSEEDTVV